MDIDAESRPGRRGILAESAAPGVGRWVPVDAAPKHGIALERRRFAPLKSPADA
jgi:hypothetical protein